ncbi:MAG: chitobiase/beta-hexosaminidase C-terminal domain-containing protein [Pirellulaceae bacterium]
MPDSGCHWTVNTWPLSIRTETCCSNLSGFPQQYPSVSYGLDQNGVERYFVEATPGEANSANVYAGIVADTTFSVDRGFYDAAFEVAISTKTLDAAIYYSFDGSVPTPETGLYQLHSG